MKETGQLRDAALVRQAIVRSMYVCSKSRAQIADEMTAHTDTRVIERMLNAYAAESREDFLIPAQLVRPFCIATGSDDLLTLLVETTGLRAIGADEERLIEIGRAFVERKRAERLLKAVQL